MYCICCNKNNVIPHEYSKKGARSNTDSITEEEILWKNERLENGKTTTINNDMVSGGIIHIIEAGYGSTHDGDRIILAICDDCISEKISDATLLLFDNYMGFQNTKKEIEKSKSAYRRRKNLDDLI
jgi:hypothetical protein